jgi:hypothetical protein
MQPRAQMQATSTGDFDQQLASVLSDSLKQLGVAPGEVNITIRRGADSASARQILITYNAARIGETGAAGDPLAAPTANPVAPEAFETAWSPYEGPRDRRDAVPGGGGRLSSSGAPAIQVNEQPTQNQYNYSGPAAFNPYFTNPGNPLRPGYVLGFSNWFHNSTVYGGITGPMPANRTFFATAEGAQEALRLVRQYEPEAKLTEAEWGGGPFSANNRMFYVELPGNRMMNAGLVLNGYYNGGNGVSVESDVLLANAARSA